LTQLDKMGVPAALVTVIQTKGSTPRETGAKMIVYHDGRISGTVGGSEVEVRVIEDAIKAIADGQTRRVEYKLHESEGEGSTGMICGGVMEFFIEPLRRVPRLYIFGGGHVALALGRAAAELGYPHIVLDDRPDIISEERFPQALECLAGPYQELAANLELVAPAYVVVLTSGHGGDLDVLRGILGKPHDYLGLICSKKKKAEVFKILKEEDFSQKELDRIHAPIGLDIGGNTPAEIAISILAEVIQEFYKGK
jgi:xanthine dehydrogenase accessory factor